MRNWSSHVCKNESPSNWTISTGSLRPFTQITRRETRREAGPVVMVRTPSISLKRKTSSRKMMRKRICDSSITRRERSTVATIKTPKSRRKVPVTTHPKATGILKPARPRVPTGTEMRINNTARIRYRPLLAGFIRYSCTVSSAGGRSISFLSVGSWLGTGPPSGSISLALLQRWLPHSFPIFERVGDTNLNLLSS